MSPRSWPPRSLPATGVADFALVEQLAGLRNAFTAPPTSLQSYTPAPPSVSAAAPSSGGHYEGDGHAHGVTPSGKLVAIGNYQFDGAIAPKVTALAKQFPGLRITSGYRDPERNRRANGVKNSWHLKGRAVDFAGSAGDMQRALAWGRQNGAIESLIHNAGSGQHLHLAW